MLFRTNIITTSPSCRKIYRGGNFNAHKSLKKKLKSHAVRKKGCSDKENPEKYIKTNKKKIKMNQKLFYTKITWNFAKVHKFLTATSN